MGLVSDRTGLERGFAVFHVDAEFHLFYAVAVDDGVVMLLQGVLEFLEGETVERFPALLLRGREFVENSAPLGVLRLRRSGLGRGIRGIAPDAGPRRGRREWLFRCRR